MHPPKNTGIQNLISELVKTQSINDHVSPHPCRYLCAKKLGRFAFVPLVSCVLGVKHSVCMRSCAGIYQYYY
jgi:hypothetical protein